MNLLTRIRRFWQPAPEPDHPLSEAERGEQRSPYAFDEDARAADEFVGGVDSDET